jgi:hypothetical protein
VHRVVALCFTALALAGCGAAPSPEAAVSGSAGKSADSRTARILVSYDGMPEVTGAFDLETDDGVLDATGTHAEAVLVGDVAYQPRNSLDIDPSFAPGKRWVRSDREGIAPPLGPLVAPSFNRPRALLDFLARSRGIQPVGEGEERGEPVTRYSGLLAVDELLGALSAEEREEVEWQLEEYWPSWREEGVPVQLALDSKRRLRRADFVLSEGEELTIEIFDYGVAVEATVPPPDEVTTWVEYEEFLREECERLKKEGLEKTKAHCVGGCSAGEHEGEAAA